MAWEEDKELPSEAQKPARTDGLSDELAAHISGLAFSLGLTEEEQDVRVIIRTIKILFLV